MANNLMSMIKKGLADADKQHPNTDALVMGFTKDQVRNMNPMALAMLMRKKGSGLKPKLIWFDAASDTFYDQGDATKINKSEYDKINATNFKKDTPLTKLKYYVPINRAILNESDKPLD